MLSRNQVHPLHERLLIYISEGGKIEKLPLPFEAYQNSHKKHKMRKNEDSDFVISAPLVAKFSFQQSGAERRNGLTQGQALRVFVGRLPCRGR
jgi:hypothetical protein